MRRILMGTILLCLAGCGSGFGDPCAWLPEPNQEAAVDLLFDVRADGFTRAEVFGIGFSILISNDNVFDPTPTEAANCLDDLLDEVYGE